MFSLKQGLPIAKFKTGSNVGRATINILNEGIGELGSDVQFKSKIVPVPNILKRECVYICGPSGCGKSTLVGEYLKTFKKAFPKYAIYIFSRKSNDVALDYLNPIWFPINQDMVDNPIDIIKELKNGACVVFDDCATFSDKGIKTSLSNLMKDILEVGRAQNIYCLITSHLVNPNEKKDGRVIFNESDNITIFPKGGNTYAISYALKNYLGLSKSSIDRILNLKSRWVLISKTFPNYVLYENGCYIV